MEYSISAAISSSISTALTCFKKYKNHLDKTINLALFHRKEHLSVAKKQLFDKLANFQKL
jgi:hypothetical protein